MSNRGVSRPLIYVAIFVIAVGGLAAFRFFGQKPVEVKVVPPPATTTAPTTTTAPATRPVEPPPKKLVDLLDLVRSDDPKYPTTQPLDLPADMVDAAKIVLDRPVYLDAMGRLWITHPEGKPVEEILKKPVKQMTLFVQERPVCVAYLSDFTLPTVIVKRDPKGYAMHAPRRAPGLFEAEGLRWEEAVPLGDRLLVPTAGGAHWISTGVGENFPPIALQYDEAEHTPPVIVSDGTGAFIWSPAENGKAGSHGALYVDLKRQVKLDSTNGWFDAIVQLVPLADGSTLAVGKEGTGIALKLGRIDPPRPQSPQEVQRITGLAQKLGDPDPVVREATQRELESIGPSSHAVLEKLHETIRSPEAKMRIENLLGQKFAPTLAGLHPLEGLTHTIARFRDGGCVLLLTGGGVYVENGVDQSLIPAWIAIRPGRYIERLGGEMMSNFVVGKYQLQAFGNEWLQVDPMLGPRRVLGSRMETLLPKDLRHFDQLVGIDGNKRWLFTSKRDPGKTLIIDPSLPDPTPKLPVWKIDSPDDAGWTDTGWPAVKREQRVFVLAERGWRMLDEKNEKFQTAEPPEQVTIATAPDGRWFELHGGEVRIHEDNGHRLLGIPEQLKGGQQIFYTSDRLFIVSDVGLQRWRLEKDAATTPDGPEEIFKKGLPEKDYKRVWLDPAGRIVFSDDLTLWITFPAGRVHPDVARLMLKREQAAEEKEKKAE